MDHQLAEHAASTSRRIVKQERVKGVVMAGIRKMGDRLTDNAGVQEVD
jgi:hypothetical protein